GDRQRLSDRLDTDERGVVEFAAVGRDESFIGRRRLLRGLTGQPEAQPGQVVLGRAVAKSVDPFARLAAWWVLLGCLIALGGLLAFGGTNREPLVDLATLP